LQFRVSLSAPGQRLGPKKKGCFCGIHALP
jgi:hypothetical protein